MIEGRYFVATDAPPLTDSQAARLYRTTGYRDLAVFAAQGTVEQMIQLADELNAAR